MKKNQDFKMYYTDPLAAAYMAAEFGVKFIGINYEYGDDDYTEESKYKSVADDIENFVAYEELYCPYEEYEVHPESYKIFEPQVGDLLIDGAKQSIVCGVSNTQEFKELVSNGICKIIQRDNKLFFWPEIKEE